MLEMRYRDSHGHTCDGKNNVLPLLMTESKGQVPGVPSSPRYDSEGGMKSLVKKEEVTSVSR